MLKEGWLGLVGPGGDRPGQGAQDFSYVVHVTCLNGGDGFGKS